MMCVLKSNRMSRKDSGKKCNVFLIIMLSLKLLEKDDLISKLCAYAASFSSIRWNVFTFVYIAQKDQILYTNKRW